MARRPRRDSDPLDERSGAILRAVIDEYVTSATRSAPAPWSATTRWA